MGCILVHAGTPKTGSTSIQRWLAMHAPLLRERHGLHVVRDGGVGAESLRFEPYESGPSVVSNGFVLRYAQLLSTGSDKRDRAELVGTFVRSLDRAAGDLGTVLVTAEALSTLFALGDVQFLRGLEELTGRHTLRVAYYVRPQHEALDARWRQWGYRTPVAPSEWIREQDPHLRYLRAMEHVTAHAPSISLELMLFRRDTLEDGDVVVDFARHFLGLEAVPPPPSGHLNPGLPLDLANLLRRAPRALLDTPGAVDSGRRQLDLALLARRWAIPESSGAQRSRHALHAYAHQQYEAENRPLIDEYGWPVSALVPPPPPGARSDHTDALLAELDTLWDARAVDNALDFLYAALDQCLAAAP